MAMHKKGLEALCSILGEAELGQILNSFNFTLMSFGVAAKLQFNMQAKDNQEENTNQEWTLAISTPGLLWRAQEYKQGISPSVYTSQQQYIK